MKFLGYTFLTLMIILGFLAIIQAPSWSFIIALLIYLFMGLIYSVIIDSNGNDNISIF